MSGPGESHRCTVQRLRRESKKYELHLRLSWHSSHLYSLGTAEVQYLKIKDMSCVEVITVNDTIIMHALKKDIATCKQFSLSLSFLNEKKKRFYERSFMIS